MKYLSKVAAIAGATTIASVAALTPVLADSPGQLEGGSLVYKVKNVTQNGSYANTVSAKACDELQYSIDLHNTEYGALHNIMVKVNLPSGSTTSNVSTMTASPDAGGTTGTSGTASVNFTIPQNVTYENGTTVLYDGSGHVIKNLSDGITPNGINVGSLNGSTTEFVNFKARVNCPTTPNTPGTPGTPGTSETPGKGGPVAPAGTTLPDTGAESGLAGLAGTGALGYAVMQYRRSRVALSNKLRDRK